MTDSDDEVGQLETRCACGEVWSIYTWPHMHAPECDAFSLDDSDEFGGGVADV